MKLSHIRDILAVAEAGSLRSASRKLGITQPTMTRSIRDIEHELGVALFTRHANGVTPTKTGQLFLRRARIIQSEIRRISDDVDHAKGQFTGQVSIATIFSTGLVLLPTAFSEFQKRFPNSKLRISESLYRPIENDILSGEIDFYVGPLSERPFNTLLTVEPLFENHRVIVARKGHPLLSATSLEELQSAKWVRGSLSESPDESDLEALFARSGLAPPEIAMQTRSAILSLMTVINSDLLALTPIQCLQFAAISEWIDTVKLEKMLPGAPICVVRRNDVPLTPLAETLWNMICKIGANYDRRQRKIN